MRKLFLFISVLMVSTWMFAQAPNKMTYQAVVRDAGGNLVASSNVGFRVSLLQGSISGPSVFTETHAPITNANGLATFEIGGGTIISGSIATIDWGAGPYFIKTEVDPAGGTSYSIVSTHQLLSVPYSFYSNTSGYADSSGYANTAGYADSSGYAAYAGSVGFPRTYLYAEKKATLQNVANNTNTTITNFDSYTSNGISFNTATGTVTFNTSGIYMITAQNSFGALNPGRKLLWLNCFSSNWGSRIASTEISNDANRITTSFVGAFNVGDQLTMGAFQTSGVTVPCPNNTQAFDITLINIERIQ